MSQGGSSMYGSGYNAPNPFVRRPYQQGQPMQQSMPSMGMSQGQMPQGFQMPQGYNPFMRPYGMSMGKRGMEGGMNVNTMFGAAPPPPVGTAPPPPVGQQPPPNVPTPTPSPTPAPYVPPPTPTPTPYSPPTPDGGSPMTTPQWGVTQGPYGGGANGLLAYNTAIQFDPYAAANRPADSGWGYNQLTRQWEAFK